MFKKIISVIVRGIILIGWLLLLFTLKAILLSDFSPKTEVAEEAVVETAKKPGPNLITGQRNCFTRAKSYLKYTNFSKEGLRDQLRFEDFEDEDIDYVLNELDVDYKEQAVKKAQAYLDLDGFSRDRLYEQLAFDKFTDEEIGYALEKVGY